MAGIIGALFAVPLIAAGNTMVLSLAGHDEPGPGGDSEPLGDDAPVDGGTAPAR